MNLLRNSSFESISWADKPAGNTLNQEPEGWQLSWKAQGAFVDSAGEFLNVDHPPLMTRVTVAPEVTHVGLVPHGDHDNLYWNIPEDERPGGPRELFRDGVRALKVFAGSGVFSAALEQTVDVPSGRYRAGILLNVHHYHDFSPGAAVMRLQAGDWRSDWQTLDYGFSDRRPVRLSGEFDHDGGPLAFRIVLESRTLGSVNYFIDDARLERIQAPDEPEPPEPSAGRAMTPPGLHLTTGDSGASDEYRSLHEQLRREFPDATETEIGQAMPPVKVYGTPELAQTLRLFKQINPYIKTAFRLSSVPGSGWNIEGPRIDDPRAYMDVVHHAVEPYLGVIDVLELINEQDPVGVEGHLKLAAFMDGCAQYAEDVGITVGLFSYSLGVPEWDEIQAIVGTGVFDHDNIELHLHEYATPLNENFGHTIPDYDGDTSDRGPLAFRYRFWRDLTDVPIAITELNLARMEDYTGAEWEEQMRWYLNESARDGIDVYIFGWGSLGGSWLGFDIRPYRQHWRALALDAARAILSEKPPEPPTPPTPNLPVAPYSKTYHVVEADIPLQRRVDIYSLAAALQESVGPAASDAVAWATELIDAGESVTIVPWDRPEQEHARWRNWVAGIDPRIEVVFEGGDLPSPSGPIAYSQRDPRWNAVRLGGTDYTMHLSGCLVTAFASFLSQTDPGIDPLVLVKWLNQNGGFDTQGRMMIAKPAELSPHWSFVRYHTWRAPGQVADMATVRRLLAQGPTILQVDFRPATSRLDSHFVLALRELDGDVEVMDPWTGTIRKLLQSYGPGRSLERAIFAAVEYLREDAAPPPTSVPRLGFNDPNNEGAARWMMDNSAGELLVVPVFLGRQAIQLDASSPERAGIRVIVNLRYSWSVDMGGLGTLPPPGEQRDFIAAAIKTIVGSRGVWGWEIGNEANNPREWPGAQLTPGYVAEVYNAIYDEVPDQLAPGALDPFNAQAGDPRHWLYSIYSQIAGAQFVTAHGYIRGPDPGLVGSEARFADDPLTWQYLNYPGCVTELLKALPASYQDRDVYVTEFNHLWKTTEGDWGWVDDARAGEIMDRAHYAAAAAGFAGLAIYRWQGDAWQVRDNYHVLEAVLALS